MENFFQTKTQTIVITGANGWIGTNARLALQKYNLILIDNKIGTDPSNRFGIEGIANSSKTLPAHHQFIQLDLVNGYDEFKEILIKYNPDCVIHLAGILEVQDLTKIDLNNTINNNVLTACAEQQINIIAASSIMVMYGSAMLNEKIRAALQKKLVNFAPAERLTVDSPLNNNESTLKLFSEDNWQKNLSYIKTKEKLEVIANNLVKDNKLKTAVCVRFGWSGLKNPYELEGTVEYSETSVYLDQIDLQNFIVNLTEAVMFNKVNGYQCYICVSEHPQRWVDMANAKRDFAWAPTINIVEKYAITAVANNQAEFKFN